MPGPAGAPDVALIVCRPTAATAPVPALYYIHGGGMIMGTARDPLPGVLDLAEPLGAAVVSVEYRLAPETPHPGPVEDCYAGLVWTVEHAGELGIDPERIVAHGRQRGRRARRSRGAPRARPGRAGPGGPAADVPDARRPQRLAVGAPDGRAADVEPAGQRGRLDGAARRRPRWSRRLAVRRPGPRRRPVRAAAGVHRRRVRGHASATRTSTTRRGSGRRAASPSCTSGRAATTASTGSSRTPLSRRPPSPPAANWLARLLDPLTGGPSATHPVQRRLGDPAATPTSSPR